MTLSFKVNDLQTSKMSSMLIRLLKNDNFRLKDGLFTGMETRELQGKTHIKVTGQGSHY